MGGSEFPPSLPVEKIEFRFDGLLLSDKTAMNVLPQGAYLEYEMATITTLGTHTFTAAPVVGTTSGVAATQNVLIVYWDRLLYAFIRLIWGTNAVT